MGGTLGAGNVTPKAEFNAYADPRALRLVLASGVRLRVVGLDVDAHAWRSPTAISRAPGSSRRLRARQFLDAAVRALCGAERELSGEPSARCCTTRARSPPRSRRSSSRSRRARSK